MPFLCSSISQVKSALQPLLSSGILRTFVLNARDASYAQRLPNPRDFKAYRGTQHVFGTLPHVTHVLTTDAESEFTTTRSYNARLERWSSDKVVLGGAYVKNHTVVNHTNHWRSCASVVGAPAAGQFADVFFWWQDAAVFEKTDFEDFLPRVSRAHTMP